jgi:GNAT superfamily N-acetyltransferase
MLEIKRLSECTIDEGVKAWNVGFEGYYFDATTTAENFVNRLVMEGLSPRLSIVAFKNNQPVGIVKNGIREIDGKKVAWNGGTGVSSSHRKSGIGKALMNATLEIYREEGVHTATLEAIGDNQKAIALYEKIGYKTIDQLEHLELKGTLELNVPETSYQVEKTVPQKIKFVPFYKSMNPWQTQWQSARDSEAIIIKDPTDHSIVSYAYYRQNYSPEGTPIGIVLFQCEANPDRKDAENILRFTLKQVFGTYSDMRRIVPNLPISASSLTHSVLNSLGFTPIAKQVYMVKEM